MKKTTKSMLITALVLFCCGILLALSSALYAKIAGVDIFGIPQKSSTIVSKTIPLPELLATSPDSNYVKKLSNTEFSRVNIGSFAGNVEIRLGTETKLELIDANINNLQCQIIGETLTVQEVDPVCFMGIYIDQTGISFKGLRQVFSSGNDINSNKNVILYLDATRLPKQIDINSVYGDVVLDGINSEIVNLKSSFGNVRIQNFMNPNGKLNLSGNFTSFDLSEMLYNSCSVTTTFGTINLKINSDSCKTSVLESLFGNIYVNCNVPTESFKLNLSTTLGAVAKNGENLGKKYSSSSSIANRITATTILGSINLSSTASDQVFAPVDENNVSEPKTKENEATATVEPSDIIPIN
jgi:hypothetical protein